MWSEIFAIFSHLAERADLESLQGRGCITKFGITRKNGFIIILNKEQLNIMYTEDIRYNDRQLSDSLILTIDRKNSISVTIHAALFLQWVEQTIVSNIQIKQTFFALLPQMFEIILQKRWEMFRVFQKPKQLHFFLKFSYYFFIVKWKIFQRLIIVVFTYSENNVTYVSKIIPMCIWKRVAVYKTSCFFFLK